MNRPNILFIFPDQWRGDSLSYLGHPVAETPFIDQLAHEGVCFSSCYSPSPTCIAARAALLTGQRPTTTGRMGYKDGVEWPYRNTYARCLRDSGYETMLVGKTHFYPPRARLGFERMAFYLPHSYDHECDYSKWLKKETGGLIRDTGVDLDSNSPLAAPWTHDENLHPNSWKVTNTIEYLETRDPTRPFFLQLGFHRPHPPFDPPMSYFERFLDKELPPVPVGDWCEDNDRKVDRIDPMVGRLPDAILDRSRRAYYAQLAHLDAQIGRLIRYLKARGLYKNTLIVFSSDHGEMLGDHHMFRKGNAFESSAKVPLIIRMPDQDTKSPRGIQSDTPTTLSDLMPTFLEAGGVAIPDSVEAESVMEIVKGEAPFPRDYIHGEHAPSWQWVTDGREKFVWHSQSGKEFFFDLRQDPQECHNAIQDPDSEARVKLWRQRLVDELSTRPEDGLSDGQRLISGKAGPNHREWLLTLEPERY
ncbi:arylsulfatase [Coraliomargarita parva]|uniref:arylsulfatase n=1 Tax=Coraliomargarita parva TaxID=3014050 RepID=UPI0022B34B29|nr:arylsulfatase [Coraliomargarita parva]